MRCLRLSPHALALIGSLSGCGGATAAGPAGDGGVDAPLADAAPAPPAVWPMFHRTPDHAGRAPVPGPQAARLRWKAPAGIRSIGLRSSALAVSSLSKTAL